MPPRQTIDLKYWSKRIVSDAISVKHSHNSFIDEKNKLVNSVYSSQALLRLKNRKALVFLNVLLITFILRVEFQSLNYSTICSQATCLDSSLFQLVVSYEGRPPSVPSLLNSDSVHNIDLSEV